MEGCLIGPEVNIGAYCQIDRGVVIPFCTRIGNGVWVYKGVEMTGSDIFVGPGVRFTNDKYPENNNPDWKPERTIIRSRVSIGAGAIILPGIELDRECRIAAGAIVTKDVPAGELVKGKW
jgi:acetyltransferase-like isoleucine patch superfamily enzyme